MSASEDGAGDKRCLSQESIFAKQPSQASVKATVPPLIQLSPDRRTPVARAATLQGPPSISPHLVTTDSLPRQDLDSPRQPVWDGHLHSLPPGDTDHPQMQESRSEMVSGHLDVSDPSQPPSCFLGRETRSQ